MTIPSHDFATVPVGFLRALVVGIVRAIFLPFVRHSKVIIAQNTHTEQKSIAHQIASIIMPSALRRSRRAVLTQASTYNVGDIVEVS